MEPLDFFSGSKVKIIIHATEDEEKIFRNAKELLDLDFSGNDDNDSKTDIEKTQGHWGNPILLVNKNLDEIASNLLFKKIFKSISKTDKLQLTESIEDYVDEKGNFFLRLDKQKLCKTKISLGDVDSVKIQFKPVKKGNTKYRVFLEQYRRLFLLLDEEEE